jgi:hypothetical protein
MVEDNPGSSRIADGRLANDTMMVPCPVERHDKADIDLRRDMCA